MSTNGMSAGPVPPPSSTNAEEAQLAMIEQAAGFLSACLHEKITANRAGLEDLVSRGIQIDPGRILGLQVVSLREAIAETMGASGPLWSLRAQLAFEIAVGDFIAHARTQGTKAQLAMGGSLNATQIRQMARQTGTYGG
jgi:hypothetical protein